MKVFPAWFVCLLLLGLALHGAASRAPQLSMETRSEYMAPGTSFPLTPSFPLTTYPGAQSLLSTPVWGAWSAVCQASPQSGPISAP